MPDQATELRRLMNERQREPLYTPAPPPRLILITSGKRSAGVTTISVNLAVALASQGVRVVLATAGRPRGEITSLCGLTATTDAEEVQCGPAGVRILPETTASPDRMLKQLRLPDQRADVVLLDAGDSDAAASAVYWEAANEVLLVTTADSVAVMDTYAKIKTSLPRHIRPQLSLIVNQTMSLAQPDSAHGRLDASCRRFLECGIDLLGAVPLDPQVIVAAQHALPIVLDSPESEAAIALQQLAAVMADRWCNAAAH
jgi:flagellar biosynthesis protein FlhG